MTGWRFYPLAERMDAGVLVDPDRKAPRAAVFLTLDAARKMAPRRLEGGAS